MKLSMITRRLAAGVALCAAHAQQLGGGSSLSNLMVVKD